MTTTGLLRIMFRWKRAALWALGGSLLLSLSAALLYPLRYESQAIIERKPIKLWPQVNAREGEEFDVYRLTSDSQRSVALAKSRYLLSRWLDALQIPAETPADREDEIDALSRSLTVQPISYTDLYIVKVRAKSPEEAQRRAQVLIQLFTTWDTTEDKADAQSLVTLLRERLKQVTQDLRQMRARLQTLKSGATLNLSGSAASRELEGDINAKTAAYDRLSAELESAERQIRGDTVSRTHVLAPPMLPGKPVRSRGLLVLLAICFSLLLTAGTIALLEGLDPSVHRTQEIVREAPPYPVVAIPQAKVASAEEAAIYLGPVINAVSDVMAAKGFAVIQLASAELDSKTALSASLAKRLAVDFSVCLIHRSSGGRAKNAPETANGIMHITLDASAPLDKHLNSLRERCNVVLIDNDPVPGALPGASLIRQADIACLLIQAGKTSRYTVRALRHELDRLPGQRFLFILNGFTDPLPAWLR